MRPAACWLGSLVLAATVGCGASEPYESATDQSIEVPSVGTATPIAGTIPDERPRIVALGDSLTAGLGLSPEEAYPHLLQQRLDEAQLSYAVVNAGVSGDTSAGGLSRLAWALDGDVRVLVLALGGNDALRGLPVDELRRNLSAIIERAQARGIIVVLAGMEAPPNLGAAYVSDFRAVYRDLAVAFDVALVPFLLEGVGGVAELNQTDGIHPTAGGARIVADNVWGVLEPIVVGQAEGVSRRHSVPGP